MELDNYVVISIVIIVSNKNHQLMLKFVGILKWSSQKICINHRAKLVTLQDGYSDRHL